MELLKAPEKALMMGIMKVRNEVEKSDEQLVVVEKVVVAVLLWVDEWVD